MAHEHIRDKQGRALFTIRRDHRGIPNAATGAALNHAAIHGMWARRYNLKSWLLAGSTLKCAAFNYIDFTDASFKNCNLAQAHFRLCDLRHTDFTGANLDGAVFYGCLVKGAKNLPTHLLQDCTEL